MVHSRVGSAHWHSRYKEQRGSSGFLSSWLRAVCPLEAPGQHQASPQRPGNVPGLQSESLGMGFNNGCSSKPCRRLWSHKDEKPHGSRERALCTRRHTGSSLQLQALIESSQQPRKPGSVINPTLLVKNSTHSHRGSERQRQGLKAQAVEASVQALHPVRHTGAVCVLMATSKTAVSSSWFSFLFLSQVQISSK